MLKLNVRRFFLNQYDGPIKMTGRCVSRKITTGDITGRHGGRRFNGRQCQLSLSALVLAPDITGFIDTAFFSQSVARASLRLYK